MVDDKEGATNKDEAELKDDQADLDTEEDDDEIKGDEDDEAGEKEDEAEEQENYEESVKDKKKDVPAACEKKVSNKYKDWPLRGIKEPHENDVLYGRGGGTNHHPGNKIYRRMVEERKLEYVNAKRLDKPLVALDIIRKWRAQEPPGRFLKVEEKTGLWMDVGDKKAREKTSQALREKAPEIRRKIEEEELIKQGKDPNEILKDKEKKEQKSKNTRFETGTKDQQRDNVTHAVLARDHSLGREYLGTNETLALDGFAWNPASLDRIPSYGSASPVCPPGRVASYGSEGVMPPGRVPSYGSDGNLPSSFPSSRGGSHGSLPPAMPPQDSYYRHSSRDERQRSFGSGRYDSWSRFPSGGSVPPPPIPPYRGGQYAPYRSGSFGQDRVGSYGPDRAGSFGPDRAGSFGPSVSREHSLGNFSLPDASVGHPAQGFDGRSGSGYWADPSIPPPPQAYGPPPRYMSGDHHYPQSPSRQYDQHRDQHHDQHHDQHRDQHRVPPPESRSAPPPRPPAAIKMSPYEVDPVIAQSWSTVTQAEDYEEAANVFGDEIRQSLSGENNRNAGRDQFEGSSFSTSRPDMIKRMTSNQNEDFETKPDFNGEGRSIKRAALNRDSSAAANRLKELYAPGALKRPVALEKEMRMLSTSMEQSTLDSKPKPLSLDERSNTLDSTAIEMMVKPNPLKGNSRSTTIEELDLDLDVDLVVDGNLNDMNDNLPRPAMLRTEGRLSTAEYIDIVNEPLGLDEEDGKTPLHLNREASVSEWLSQG